jgi:hypothetical protein
VLTGIKQEEKVDEGKLEMFDERATKESFLSFCVVVVRVEELRKSFGGFFFGVNEISCGVRD